jgi:hypothetical protein
LGEWRPDRLGVEQLVKHALALLSSFPDDDLHLVYVWWEPLNGDEFGEVIEHRAQVRELRERVGESRPALHALTYSDLLREWGCLDDPSWIREHVGQMKARYSLGL